MAAEAAMEVAPVEDQQKQDEESSEVINKQLTRNLLLSSVQSLAKSDDSLTPEEATQLSRVMPPAETEDPAIKVGQNLFGTGPEDIDGLLEVWERVKNLIDSILDDEGSEVSEQNLSGFLCKW